MKEKEQLQDDRHLDTPSQSSLEKHVNFPEIEERSTNIANNAGTSQRQKQWKEELREGEEERQKSSGTSSNPAISMDNDDTLGIP